MGAVWGGGVCGGGCTAGAVRGIEIVGGTLWVWSAMWGLFAGVVLHMAVM